MKQFFPQDVVHLITEQDETCEQNSMEYSQYHIIMYLILMYENILESELNFAVF